MKNTIYRVLLIGTSLLALWIPKSASGFYDPAVQRWINRDPIGERGGGNLYSFVANDPLNDADSLGLVSWQSIEDMVRSLNAMLQTRECKCCKNEVSRVDLTINGTSSGATVKASAMIAIQGCVDTYRLYWWDCYSASSEGGLSWDWKDFGWSGGESYPTGGGPVGNSTYSKTASPGFIAGPLHLRDPYNIAVDAAVIYTYCGPDGRRHAAYRFSNELIWSWDKGSKSWKGPPKSSMN